MKETREREHKKKYYGPLFQVHATPLTRFDLTVTCSHFVVAFITEITVRFRVKKIYLLLTRRYIEIF